MKPVAEGAVTVRGTITGRTRATAAKLPVGDGSGRLATVLAELRPGIVSVGLLTSAISVIALTVPLYMMNLYERVLPSRNMNTLMALTAIALFLLLVEAAIGRARESLLERLGLAFNRSVAEDLFAGLQHPSTAADNPHSGALRDLETLRAFWVKGGLTTLFALFWSPLFLLALFILHPLLGGIALATLAIMLLVAIATQKAVAPHLRLAGEAEAAATAIERRCLDARDVVQAMGMGTTAARSWLTEHEAALIHRIRASERAAPLLLLSQFTQAAAFVAVPAAAAGLALQGKISPAVIYAAMLIGRHATDPARKAIQQWRGYQAASLARARLEAFFATAPGASPVIVLPRPCGRLQLEGLTLSVPGTRRVILRNVSFAVDAGTVLAIVGPSGSGKSALARVLVNLWQPTLGQVRLDGADYGHWRSDALGAHIGYLPQDGALMKGTVAENIRRFRPRHDDDDVFAAAKLAGAHDMIQSLPEGYATAVGDNGSGLSSGQRQLIALARALYGRPALVVLDEPNAHLDSAGEAALARTVAEVKAQGTTVVLITHKAQLLALATTIALLGQGKLIQFGARDDVLRRISRQGAPRGERMRVVASS
ncbi:MULTISPECIES: type I secretion system permease/ATPase [unclassified Chelatococcus]|uniref:type I secretion system permease/ATPase n=1 Tax=unclassified Chelatococcus TaxID=2638111 RepID=UPI001BCADC64|nr:MULTISPECIES: type I secretion system permease/ATPase [unclassified Chelatococcus]MBS7697986.1 type I secretion system permease/ATPase [Chelatococcus sp. YT9]MBX3556696.1 type I secretion system permease/ATPase [Chelatococcus sp.]